jgi:hypothetical protein
MDLRTGSPSANCPTLAQNTPTPELGRKFTMPKSKPEVLFKRKNHTTLAGI